MTSASEDNLDNCDELESKFISSVIFEDNKITSTAKEQAFILGELYHKTAEKHLQLEFKSMVIGMILILLGIIVFIWGGLQENTNLASLILIILALLIFVYGFFIDKPKKLVSLSKVYTVSYIMPNASALIIDGTDIVPDQTLEYKDLPLDEIEALSEKLPDSHASFNDEQQLITTVQDKQRLLGDLRPFSITTPALLKNDTYAKAILDCMEISQEGKPEYGILNVKLDYQTALEHANKIRYLSDLGGSVSVLNREKDTIIKRANPFMQNLENCINDVDSYFNQVISIQNDHFFSGININEDPYVDKMYGYGIIPHQYHISKESNVEEHITLNPVQNAIDILDDESKDIISMSVKNVERTINQRTQSCEDMVDQIEANTRVQSSQMHSQIMAKFNEYEDLNKRRESLNLQIDNQFEDQKDYNQKIRNEKYQQYPDQSLINQYQMLANECDRRVDDLSFQRDGLSDQISSVQHEQKRITEQRDQLIDQANSNIENTKRKAEQDINQLQNELLEELQTRRAHIEPIIEARDRMLSMIEGSIESVILSKNDRHRKPFEVRLTEIQDLLNQTLSELEVRSEERSVILEQIDSIRFDISIDKPISIMIPYWIACLEEKERMEYVILPLQKTIKPEEPLKGRKTVNILSTLFQSFESSKHYLQNDSICSEAASYSIYPDKLDSNISTAIDELSNSGYLSEGIAKRMKKVYNIQEGGT